MLFPREYSVFGTPYKRELEVKVDFYTKLDNLQILSFMKFIFEFVCRFWLDTALSFMYNWENN